MTNYLLPASVGVKKGYLKTLPLFKYLKSFQRLISPKIKNEKGLSDLLMRAHLNATAREYKGWGLGFTVLLAIIFIPSSIILYLLSNMYYFLALIAAPVVFYFLIPLLPRQYGSSLKKKMGGLRFIVFLNFFNVFASSGIPLEQVFEHMTSASTFGELAVECRRIVNNIKYYGMDVMGAMRESARTSPSDDWSGFLEGIVVSAQSGSDVVEYINNRTEYFIRNWDKEVEKQTETLNVFSEIYLIVGSAFPVLMIFMIGVMSALGPTVGMDPRLTLLISIVIPASMAGAFGYVIHASVKEGFL